MTQEHQPILTLQAVRKSYRGRAALQGISLQLFPGGIAGFFRPERCWKNHDDPLHLRAAEAG